MTLLSLIVLSMVCFVDDANAYCDEQQLLPSAFAIVPRCGPTPCTAGAEVRLSVVSFEYIFTGCESFEWAFGDGTGDVVSRSFAVHKYSSGGTYVVTVKIRSQFQQVTISKLITIPESIPLTSNLGALVLATFLAISGAKAAS